MLIHDLARHYLANGWAAIPIPAGTKKPILAGWQKLRLTAEQVEQHFAPDSNIGVLLGKPSGGLIDVDLDHPLAVELAPQFLPPTAARFGRASKRQSHWLYQAEDATTHKRRVRIDDADVMLVELRSTGCQTVFPTSIHPSGEQITWDSNGEPAVVNAAELQKAVDALADEICRRQGIDPAQSKPVKPRLDASAWAVDGAERARRYVAKMPPAIAGQGGHNQTFSVACEIFRFGLTDAEATGVLAEYNARCVPPWSDGELSHKLIDARAAVLASGEFGMRLRNVTAVVPVAVSSPADHAAEALDDHERQSAPDDPGPMPDDLTAVPGFIGDVMRFNLDGAHKPQPVLALAGALSLLATLTGRKITDTQGTRTNLYAIGVSGTSTGKQRAREINKDLLFAAGLESMIGAESIGSAQGLVNEVVAQPAILFQLDEMGRYLKTMSDSREPHLYNIISVFMRMFTDSGSIFRSDAVVDPKRIKTIHNPHPCIYGTTTREALYNALTIDSLHDGFLSRVLVFEGDDGIAKRRIEKPTLPASLIEQARFWGGFNPGGNLSSANPRPLIVQATPAAGRIFAGFDEAAEADQRQLGEPLGALWPRATEKANKLALLYACSENPHSPIVTDAAATWAVELVSYLTTRLVFLSSRWVSENRIERTLKRIARIIEDAGPGGITKTALIGKTRFITTRERDEILSTLVESCEARHSQVKRAGRPQNVYVHRRWPATAAA